MDVIRQAYANSHIIPNHSCHETRPQSVCSLDRDERTLPDFSSQQPLPHDLASYKDKLMKCLHRRSQSVCAEQVERDTTNVNKWLKACGEQPVSQVSYTFCDQPNKRSHFKIVIGSSQVDANKKKVQEWNAQQQRYPDFMVTVGSTKYEETDLNDAKEGRYRRQLMY